MAVRRGHACTAAAISVTNAYQAVAVLGSTAVDTRATAIPDECLLSWLRGQITTIAGGATSITWYLAEDSAGDIPLTDAQSETILTGMTTATKGGIATAIDLEYVRASSGTQGSIYLVLKTNAGTCTLTPRIVWREDL